MLNVSDPVTMYLLTELAIGDSMHYEIMSFEEIESLKKEYKFLSARVDAMKRKLALERKLRDAAQSLSRLNSRQDRHGSRDCEFDDELANSNRKCEELSQELWKLESRAQEIQRRLLEHTAGVLQMTHKGLKKNMKKATSRSPDSVYSSQTHGSIDDFDERSLYKTPEYFNDFGANGKGVGLSSRDTDSMSMVSAIQNAERRLEELSGRMREMVLQADPHEEFGPIPQPSSDGGPVNPVATVEAHLAYIERGLDTLGSHTIGMPRITGPTGETEQELTEINSRFYHILGQTGLPRSPTIPPPPNASAGGVEDQLSYLRAGVDNLQSRIDGLLEQKSILKTQIQQQRELNSKSDAEKDAHTANLVEQLAVLRKNFELSEREGQALREELSLVRDQPRGIEDPGALASEREARARAEQEVSRLESVLQQVRAGAEAQEAEIETIRSDSAREIARLQSIIEELHSKADARAEEATEARDRAEQELSQLEAAMEQTRADAEARVQEATALRVQAEKNADRLQSELTELEGEIVRAQTELTVVKAELDGAYGTRAQRAAEVAANPIIQREMDSLNKRNQELTEELETLKTNGSANTELQQRVELLEKELRETIDDYEAMTKASIEFEKERETYESIIDGLRERCEQLEVQFSEERINWMGNVNSPTSAGREVPSETISTMVLKNEFKKMMRDTRAENLRILKVSRPLQCVVYIPCLQPYFRIQAEQEERRRLEAMVRSMKQEQANSKSSLSQKSGTVG